MPLSLKQVHAELKEVKVELKRLNAVLREDFELSETAKKELVKARKEPISKYIDHKEVLKEFS